MYVSRYIETRSRNHCCRGKAISITYYGRMSAALVIHCAVCMRRIVIRWSVWLYHIFPHYFTNGTLFGGKSYWT